MSINAPNSCVNNNFVRCNNARQTDSSLKVLLVLAKLKLSEEGGALGFFLRHEIACGRGVSQVSLAARPQQGGGGGGGLDAAGGSCPAARDRATVMSLAEHDT